mgnify:CR=1 FL=1
MKPGLRKVAALILASATLFGSGASAVSAAYADDTTMGTSTRIQAEPDKTITGGDEAATKPDAVPATRPEPGRTNNPTPVRPRNPLRRRIRVRPRRT